VLFLPPALLLFTLFVVLPIAEAGWYSGIQLERLRAADQLGRARQLPFRVRVARVRPRVPQQHPDHSRLAAGAACRSRSRSP
jgi:ABC-type sugar transport system permease subunit